MQPYKNKTVLCLCLFFLLASNTNEAASPKALGMGIVGVAYPQDALSSAYNPANAGEITTRLDCNLLGTYTPYHSKITNNPNPQANGHIYGRRTWGWGAAIGYNRPLCDDFSVGFILYNRAFIKTHYNKSTVLAGTSQLGFGYEKYCASGVLAHRIGCHQIGISLDLLVGRHKVSGLQLYDNPFLTVAPGRLTNRGYDWNWGLGVTLGWLWNVTPCFKVGVAFRPETKMSRFHKYKGYIPQRGIVHSPQNLAGGFSWKFLPCTTVALDVEYSWFRRLRCLKNPLASDLFLDKLGSTKGSSYGYRNLFILHVGLDHEISDDLVVRCGYMYGRGLVPSSQTFFNTLTCNPIEHYMTLGATYQYNACVEASLYYLHGFKQKLNGTNVIPPVLGGGDVTLQRSLDILGIGIGVNF